MFNVGDRVIGTNFYQGNMNMIGVKGTIILNEGGIITVEYDKNIKGDSGVGGNGKKEHCWSYKTTTIDCCVALINPNLVELI